MAKNEPDKNDPANTPEAHDQADDQAARQPAGAESDAASSAAASSGAAEPLRAELDEAKDRALRLQAELENVRRRAARELHDERRYANLPLLRDLLPVLDNLDRAVDAAERSHDGAGLLDGVKIVAQQLNEVLGRHHCVPIETLHQPFDPHRHEAILQQPSAEHPPGTVLLVTQGGFQLHDRVVRPSQVIIACEAPSDAEDNHAEGNRGEQQKES